MKIYTKVVLDFATGNVEQEEYFEYRGPVAECKGGGGGGGDNVDEEYNARMATIYEAQQDMADEYFDFWKSDYQPMEREQIAANRELIPDQTALAKEQIASNRELLPLQTETSKKQLGVRQELMDQASKGIDVDSRVSQAEADVRHGYGMAATKAQRNFSRSGLNQNSGRFAAMQKDLALSEAQSVAGARTKARRNADDENFKRLKSAASFGMG
ncbi:hypothetical protein [Maridesulfovibrio sp.]|uniref:hypothetical protein n=1 Tax=Maridesulfovibrio sp. TaxID=2795000 RepID=UPI0029C9C124|nr:hypothetical protein [Maridesulfovibrio sp.]